jgi:hypothetical protein
MELSPEAEDRAFKLLGEYGEHLRSEAERIATLWDADRVSAGHVDHAAANLRIQRHISHLPEALASIGLLLSGMAIGLSGAAILIDEVRTAGPLVVAFLSGGGGLGSLVAGVVLHLSRRAR